MNLTIIWCILLITIPHCIDNRVLYDSTIKFRFFRNHTHNIIQNPIKYQSKQNKFSESSNQKNIFIQKRSFECASHCQPHDCCRKTRCLCLNDYWGPVCYCKK